MTIDGSDPPGLPALPAEVVARLAAELPSRDDKIAACIDTAAALIEQAMTGAAGLRLVESAAYNLREALDAVVSNQQAAIGGLPAVLDAWAQYETEQQQPETDSEASRAALEEVLSRVATDRERSSWRARQLLEYIRAKTGIEPLPGDLDPTIGYARLREDANSALHNECALAEAVALYDSTISWFVRFFTPPDAQLQALSELASQRYSDTTQIEDLRRLATNAHHLRFFFSRIVDPTWLDALFEAGLILMPQPGEPWPAANLIAGLGATEPQCVADLLSRLFGEVKTIEPGLRLGASFELLRVASLLGTRGHAVAARVVAQYGSDRWVRVIGVSIAKDAEPTAPIVAIVADAVLGREQRVNDGRQTVEMLERLEAGLTAENVAERLKMVSAKVRRLAKEPRMKFVALDIAALTVNADNEREAVVVLAHYLVRLAARARALGVATSQLLDWAAGIPGEIGERVICQLLTGATDVPPQRKIDHIAVRIGSNTATGDDRDLINDVLRSNPAPDQLEVWAAALGEPSQAADESPDGVQIPVDWARAWRWSMVLPKGTLTRWREPILHVAQHHGEPSTSSMRARLVQSWSGSGRSPHSAEDLSALSPVAAATLISAWRPDADSAWNLVSARELARTLEGVVKADLDGWTKDPMAIVTTLREPVYVLHYFRALTENVSELTERAPGILDAARLVREARWEPAPIGRDDYDFEPAWNGVDDAIVDMIAALANGEGHLTTNLDEAWTWMLEVTSDVASDRELDNSLDEHEDTLSSAINHPWGGGLEAVLALAGWEFRNRGKIRPALETILDDVIHVPGSVGMEFRSILARRRPFLEAVAPTWLDANADSLLREGEAGQATFDLTLRWSRPTPWFLNRFRSELFAAARRGVENSVPWLLVGTLRREDGYGIDEVIGRLRSDAGALRSAASEIASLVQDADPDAPELSIAVDFWRALLDPGQPIAPLGVLDALGHWAFVTGVDEVLWLELMDRTLRLTDGLIDYPVEIADRCKAVTSSTRGLAMLLLLVARGEPWERDYIERAALEALRVAARQPVDDNFWHLRTRLMELGRSEALDITPDENR